MSVGNSSGALPRKSFFVVLKFANVHYIHLNRSVPLFASKRFPFAIIDTISRLEAFEMITTIFNAKFASSGAKN